MSEKLKVVIVGGGTAGWMGAAALSNLGPEVCTVTLVESDEIGTVGVGEATIPAMKEFNDHIGIIESEMMQRTNATFKLGIEFVGWGSEKSSYIHPFGTFGEAFGGSEFIHHWSRLNTKQELPSIEAYSYSVQACRKNRFDFAVKNNSEINSTYSHAYHFDAGLYARFLREFSEKKGLSRIEGKVNSVEQNSDTGNIKTITLASGQAVEGDLFIDCTGFKSLLMGETLATPFEDWSSWLLCDRAWTLPTAPTEHLPPFTQATAKEAGWQWKIPLQNRTGNGLVFSSQFMSEDEACQKFMSSLDEPETSEPKLVKFKSGRRIKSWSKNCISIGLANGFLEPLESTSIYLIQVAVMNLLKLFPSKKIDPNLSKEFNRLVDLEYDRVRDFLILHYKLNARNDSDFWAYCNGMEIPDTLKQKIEVFKKRGYVETYRYGLFSPPSWLSVFVGQGLIPESYDPFVDNFDSNMLQSKMSELVARINARVDLMPTHKAFIADYCAAK